VILKAWEENCSNKREQKLQKTAAIDMEAAKEWKSKLQNLLNEYPPENQFNADETGLFYRQMPRKSLVQKGGRCKGGKLSKERLSVLMCCSATGEKLRPLVIGNVHDLTYLNNNMWTLNSCLLHVVLQQKCLDDHSDI
jgi:hypothetical protein